MIDPLVLIPWFVSSGVINFLKIEWQDLKTSITCPKNAPGAATKAMFARSTVAGCRYALYTRPDMSANTIEFTREMLRVNLYQLVHPSRSPTNRAGHHLSEAVTKLLCRQTVAVTILPKRSPP